MNQGFEAMKVLAIEHQGDEEFLKILDRKLTEAFVQQWDEKLRKMNISFLRSSIILALFATFSYLSLYGGGPEHQLAAVATQNRVNDGIILKLVLTNISSKPVKIVVAGFEKTFSSRGGQLGIILQEPEGSTKTSKDSIVSLLPNESRQIRSYPKTSFIRRSAQVRFTKP